VYNIHRPRDRTAIARKEEETAMAERVVLPVLSSSGGPLVPCTQCARCCTYVAVGINPPTRPRYATDILWYLYHDQVTVFRDEDNEWAVVFETRCRHLGADLLCGIYPRRPHICRAFDNTGCEVNLPQGGRSFQGPEEFLAYLQAERPRLYARLAGFVPPAGDQPRTARRLVPAARARRRAAPRRVKAPR